MVMAALGAMAAQMGAQQPASGASIQQPAAATKTAAAAANKSNKPLLPPNELLVVTSTYPLQLNSPQRAIVLSALTDLSRQYFVFEGKEITPARPADFANMTYKRVCVCVCVGV
jgi:hypothetical protein